MRKILFFTALVLFLLGSGYVLMQKTAAFTDNKTAPYTKTEPYSEDVIVSSPSQDAVVNGKFAITGKVAKNTEKIKSVQIIVTEMHDKTQEPVKVYRAVYNPQSAEWSAMVNQGDLPDDAYALCITVQDVSGKQQSTYSSVTIDSSIPSHTTTSGTI